MKKYNSRYVAWCRAMEINPEEVKWSGSIGAAYINWISKKWSEWRVIHGKEFEFTTDKDHADFDTWLAGR